MKHRILPSYFILLSVLAALFQGCWVLFNPSYDYDDVTTKRIADQTYYGDSLSVFFVEYVNPYPDKEVLWFSSFIEGNVEMDVYNTETDSLEAIYHFEPQDTPLFVVAYRTESQRLVKCVVRVNSRPKCARLLPAFYPLPQPQWGTEYRVEEVK